MKGPYSVSKYSELGTTGLNHLGGFIDEEFLPQLRYPQAARVYQEMSDNDAVISAILYLSKQMIKRAGWSVTRHDDSDEAKEAQEFLESCMNDMEKPWDDVMDDVLTYFSYGFAFLETVYKIRGGRSKNKKFNSKYDDRRIGWRKMPLRAANSMAGWEIDDYGEATHFIQQAAPKFETVKIPLSKGLLFRTTSEKDNPEGRSLLRGAYRSWYFKKRIEEIEGIGIERDLAGLPVMKPPAEADLWDDKNPKAREIREYAEKAVRNIRRDASEGLVIPSDWEFSLTSTGGSRQFDTTAIINRHDQRIAITMLSDLVLMGTDKGGGSFALGESKKSLMAVSLEAQTKRIAEVFNSFAVPTLFEMNDWEMEHYPQIRPGEIELPDIKELAFLLRATGMNVNTDYKLMNFLRKLVSVEPLTEDEFINLYKEPAERVEQAELQAQQNKKPTVGSGLASKGDITGHAMDDASGTYEGH